MSRDSENLTEENNLRGVAPAWLGSGMVAVCLMGMLAMTWRRWCEPVVDFGRELYVPWQLAQGKVLYRDIAYFNGPFSPYFNAILFRLFGVSLMTLVYANIAILCGVIRMMYVLVEKISDELAAAVGCCAFVIMLAVGQAGAVGNYNFITPYSHEMTHGIALSLGAIYALARFIETRKAAWIALCGALIGILFLTKPEIFFAAVVAMSIGVFAATRGSSQKWIERGLFVACAIAVVGVALALLCVELPVREAASGMLRGWRWAVDPAINGLPFYQRVRGTFDIDETLKYQLAMTAGYAVVFGGATLVARLFRHSRANKIERFVVSFIVCAGMLWWAKDWFEKDWIKWEEVGRPLIWVAAICAVVSFADMKTPAGILRLVFSVFAFLLLGKIGLHVIFYHYGFALAAPALVIAIAAGVSWVPTWIDKSGGSGVIVRGATVGAICLTAGMYLYYEHAIAGLKTVQVGTGADAFYATGPGATVNRVVDLLDRLPPNASVAVVPQGVMANYLARRTNPTPYIVLMPPEVIMFKQGGILESFVEHPPDYVVYLGSNVSEYGFVGFNVDYGKPIFDWIVANYHPVAGNPQDLNLKWVVFQRNPTVSGGAR